MILVSSREQARQARRWWDGTFLGMSGNYVYDYFGRDRAGPLAEAPLDRSVRWPQAFFVEGPPGSVLPAHFHLVDQFQVLFGGGGRIGRRPMERFGIHYANAYSSYGPVVAGSEGFNYFTLRNCWDPTLAHRMPHSRAELEPEPRRHLHLDPPPPATPEQLGALSVPSTLALHGPEPDGLGVWLHRISAGQGMIGPDPASGAGQYWIVVSGSMARDAQDLAVQSCLFLSEEEEALEAVAGANGAELLTVQFPIRVPRRS